MLKARVITAIFLSIAFLLALFFASKAVWTWLIFAVTLLGVWEWARLIKLNKQAIYCYVGLALLLGLLLVFSADTQWAFYRHQCVLALLGLSALFWLFIAPIWLALRKKIENKWLMGFWGLVLLLSTWLALDGLKNLSPWLLLGVLLTVWLADSGAYFAGKRFGRHQLAPEISPGKTWQGVAGGVLVVIMYGLALCYYRHYHLCLVLGLCLIVVLSIMGDLFESLLKRQAGVKDSSQLLPGHGGILDRIDGLISTLPLALLYAYSPLLSNIQPYAG